MASNQEISLNFLYITGKCNFAILKISSCDLSDLVVPEKFIFRSQHHSKSVACLSSWQEFDVICASSSRNQWHLAGAKKAQGLSW
jgi:hypothetical protein